MYLGKKYVFLAPSLLHIWQATQSGFNYSHRGTPTGPTILLIDGRQRHLNINANQGNGFDVKKV